MSNTQWRPIETAPKDNKRPLYIAQFNADTGQLIELDWDATWEAESESWEMPQVYYIWCSANGRVEEPTHWAYQDEPLPPAQLSDAYRHVVDQELVCAHLGTAEPDDTHEQARTKLAELMAWHVQVATDPAVNGGFHLVPATPASAPVAWHVELHAPGLADHGRRLGPWFSEKEADEWAGVTGRGGEWRKVAHYTHPAPASGEGQQGERERDILNGETESVRISALVEWLRHEPYRCDMLSIASATLQAVYGRATQQQTGQAGGGEVKS